MTRIGEILKTALVICGAGAFQAASGQATLNVPSSYPTIQSALIAANGGDIVQVASGIYAENIDFLGKAVTVRGAGKTLTFLDGNPSAPMDPVVTMTSAEGPLTVLEHLSVRHPTMSFVGTGILLSDAAPTIRHCRISVQSMDTSTGILGTNASPIIRDCEIAGGLFTVFVYGVSISAGSPTIAECDFTNNFGDLGAGLSLSNCFGATVRQCEFHGNGTGNGDPGSGGLRLDGGSALIERCDISGNTQCGLIINGGSHAVVNCEISNNYAGMGPGFGMWLTSTSPLLLHCTLLGNTDTGIRLQDASPTLVNSIVFGGTEAFSLSGSSAPLVRYSDIQGGWPGPGNLSAPPAAGSLLFASPVVDAGDPSWPSLPDTDLQGAPRLLYFAPDMGATEVRPAGALIAPSLSITQPSGSVSATVEAGGTPLALFVTLLNTDPANAGAGLGRGRWGGLHMDPLLALLEVASGMLPFFGVLDATGTTSTEVPLPPGLTGVMVYGITHTFDSGTGVLDGASPVIDSPLL